MSLSACHGAHVGVRGQFAGASSLLPSWGLWAQTQILTEPRHLPSLISSEMHARHIIFDIRTPLVICACWSQQWSYFSIKEHIIKLDITQDEDIDLMRCSGARDFVILPGNPSRAFLLFILFPIWCHRSYMPRVFTGGPSFLLHAFVKAKTNLSGERETECWWEPVWVCE